MFLSNITPRFGKVLGIAVLGAAGLMGTTKANADGFRFVINAPPIIVQQPLYQAPVYATPVYSAPIAVAPACPAPVIVQQPVYAPAPVYAQPTVIYTQPEHRGWFDWFRGHDRDDHRFDRDHRDFHR
jgi:hypothetical protein